MKPPILGLNGNDIGHLWTIGDAIRIEKEFREKKRLLIIGGGFISLMLAWVAHERGIEVTIIELMPHVMPQTLDQKAAEILETEIQKTGTRLLTGTVVESIQKRSEGTYNIYPANQPSFPVDMVIVAAGASPNLGFVDPDLIEVDRGIVVNDRMETSVPDIYAAGDVAQGPSAFGGPHIVQALWTTAVEHGQIAGVNMAGEEVHYQGGLGNNVSEFFHVTVASIGLLEESADMTAREYVDSEKRTCLKLFFDGNVPVGGMMLGSPEDVSSFGVLKSYILRRRDLPDMKTLLASTIRPVCRSASTADADTLMKHRVARS
jgi:nitrite reductase (NADH) large subunit